MATHSNVFAWRILWAEELGQLQSIGSRRCIQDQNNLAYMHALYVSQVKPVMIPSFSLCFFKKYFFSNQK